METPTSKLIWNSEKAGFFAWMKYAITLLEFAHQRDWRQCVFLCTTGKWSLTRWILSILSNPLMIWKPNYTITTSRLTLPRTSRWKTRFSVSCSSKGWQDLSWQPESSNSSKETSSIPKERSVEALSSSLGKAQWSWVQISLERSASGNIPCLSMSGRESSWLRFYSSRWITLNSMKSLGFRMLAWVKFSTIRPQCFLTNACFSVSLFRVWNPYVASTLIFRLK